ncbi:DUF6882 domain-containing protein [Nocardia sp. FBN12]|uniref:DUF6882 domain-containing protein n=1 Tax=Nocardia sp. FBN12 TaxID=3419766 RepID=UPI003CFC14B9
MCTCFAPRPFGELALAGQLADVAGDRGWSCDLTAGRFTLTGDQPIECERMHLLGSAAPGPQSWLWSWGNPAGYPNSLTGLAQTVRDFGIRYGISELADAEVPFGALPGSLDRARRGDRCAHADPGRPQPDHRGSDRVNRQPILVTSESDSAT